MDSVRMLERDGFALCREVIGAARVDELRAEAGRVAAVAGSACVRDVEGASSVIADLASSRDLAALLPDGLAPVRVILFDKTPEENWPVGWHQDLSIAVAGRREVEGYAAWTVKNGVPHVQPPLEVMEPMVTARLHLDETPAENGALRVVPGSHRLGRIPSDRIVEAVAQGPVTCACGPGDVLLMKPLLLHASSRSESAAHRRVIHIEYADRSALAPELRWHLDVMPGQWC